MTPPSRTVRSFAATACAALLLPGSAAAWSANGHRTVARIALTQLKNAAARGDAASQAALDAITGLLGPNYDLPELARCADEIRRVDEETGKFHAEGATVSCGGLQLTVDPNSEPWHFVNVAITQPDSPDSVSAACGNAGCVVGQIKKDVATLQDPGADATAKQYALMYLVHFVGDEHQPLHCATEIIDKVDDRGGNGKQVRFNGLAMNMHALWDHLIRKTDNDPDNDPETLAQTLAASLPSDAASSWTQGDFVVGAAVESLGIAEQAVYPAYYDAAGGGTGSASAPRRRPQASQDKTRGPAVDLPADYASRMRPIVEQRLQMAGVRLAVLLKQALGGSAAAAKAAKAPAKAPRPALAP